MNFIHGNSPGRDLLYGRYNSAFAGNTFFVWQRKADYANEFFRSQICTHNFVHFSCLFVALTVPLRSELWDGWVVENTNKICQIFRHVPGTSAPCRMRRAVTKRG
jgi:hypothetical protein